MVKKGSCLCGDVTYELEGPFRKVQACHCTQCRKTSGHFWAATSVAEQRFKLLEDKGLKWFRSSSWAERGFCQNCGASLFWKMDDRGDISIAAGTLDDDSGIETDRHICMATKGGYYEINDGLPQEDKW